MTIMLQQQQQQQRNVLVIKLLLYSLLFISTFPTTDALSLPTQQTQQQPIIGIIFDMDGTLIEPCIDFASMRSRIYALASQDRGYPVTDGDVVTMVDTFTNQDLIDSAHAVFRDIEARALRDMKLMPDMLDICRYLDDRGIRRAVLTRNVMTSVDYLYDTYMMDVPRFQPQVARDTICDGKHQKGVLLAKPQPDGIQYICRQWQCHPSQVIMVGDSDKDDVVAGNRAGCAATVLLRTTTTGCDNDSGNGNESDKDERQPTVVVDSLSTLQRLLEESNCCGV